MSDMYSKVSQPADRPKYRRGSAIFIAFAAAVIVIALAVLWAYGVLSVRPRYYEFISSLSRCTIYAYEHDSLRAEVDGAPVHVSGDNAYSLYNSLSAMSPNRLLRSVPDGAADIVLDYGNGSRLLVWTMKQEDGQPLSRGIDLLFESEDGTSFLFQLKTNSISALRQWVRLSSNEPWELE